MFTLSSLTTVITGTTGVSTTLYSGTELCEPLVCLSQSGLIFISTTIGLLGPAETWRVVGSVTIRNWLLSEFLQSVGLLVRRGLLAQLVGSLCLSYC